MSFRNFLRGMETHVAGKFRRQRVASETSLEGWKPVGVFSRDPANVASETSLEGWKRRSTGTARRGTCSSETSLEGWKQAAELLGKSEGDFFRNFLRGMETGSVIA